MITDLTKTCLDRARAKLAPGDHGKWYATVKHHLPNLVQELAAAYERAYLRGICDCCGRPFRTYSKPGWEMRDITFDISAHGDPYWAVMCNSCNASRGSRTMAEWEARKACSDAQGKLFCLEGLSASDRDPGPKGIG